MEGLLVGGLAISNSRLLIFIILGCCISINAADSEDQYNVNKAIESSNNPIYIILAIDSSASMAGNGNDAKSVAIEFLSRIEHRNNTQDKVGYVSWSYYPVSFSPLISNYNELSKAIGRINFSGNTCIKSGLDKSADLLNEAKADNVRRIIVLISDGQENCNNTKNLTCEDVPKYENLEVYTVQVGSSDFRDQLLRCIATENNGTDYNYQLDGGPNIILDILNLSDTLELIPTKPTYINRDKVEKTKDEDGTTIMIPARGKNIELTEINTDVRVEKRIEQGASGPRIVIKLKAPPSTRMSLVIALDSSGSFGRGGYPEYSLLVRNVMPEFLQTLNETYPESNISILIWDDKVDFIYKDLKGTRQPQYSKLVPIDQAIGELNEMHVFAPATEREFRLGILNKYLKDIPILLHIPLLAKVNEDYNPNDYRCDESNYTDFNVALRNAIDILDRDPTKNMSDDPNGRYILLVTGRSEFTDCDPKLIAEAREKNYRIHPIGMRVITGSDMDKSLGIMADQTNGTKEYTPGSKDWTENKLHDALNTFLKRPDLSVRNISIVETVYPYLSIDNSSVTLAVDGQNKLNGFKKQILSNNNTSLYMELTDAVNAGSYIEVSIDTKLNMSLPVDVTSDSVSNEKLINYIIDENTPRSYLRYAWYNNNTFTVSLPENTLNISP